MIIPLCVFSSLDSFAGPLQPTSSKPVHACVCVWFRNHWHVEAKQCFFFLNRFGSILNEESIFQSNENNSENNKLVITTEQDFSFIKICAKNTIYVSRWSKPINLFSAKNVSTLFYCFRITLQNDPLNDQSLSETPSDAAHPSTAGHRISLCWTPRMLHVRTLQVNNAQLLCKEIVFPWCIAKANIRCDVNREMIEISGQTNKTDRMSMVMKTYTVLQCAAYCESVQRLLFGFVLLNCQSFVDAFDLAFS